MNTKLNIIENISEQRIKGIIEDNIDMMIQARDGDMHRAAIDFVNRVSSKISSEVNRSYIYSPAND